MTQTRENSLARSRADAQAIQHLKESISGGKNWYLAVLEAIGLWGSAEETIDGRLYRYLVGGEAFDWLLLVERLCCEVDGLIPEEEKFRLLFAGTPPIELPPGEFRRLIGNIKYRAYLNYFYGVVVEEALLAAVEEEILKEYGHMTLVLGQRVEEEAYHRIYNVGMVTLLERFRNAKGYPQNAYMTLTEKKEFTYWLFKYRIDHSEKARVASDTKKALAWLQRQWSGSRKHLPGETMDSPLLLGFPADHRSRRLS